MTKPQFQSWQSIRDEVRRRIHAREWKPGDLIPNEVDLAHEFGCARTTVNRALRSLAEAGLLDRRRKSGTRVAAQPAAKATLTIAVIRQEVEDRGQRYAYHRIERREATPPPSISGAMKTPAGQRLLHVQALHLADDQPYAFEDRWINPSTVPDALTAEFDTFSANEWLLKHTPYTHGDIAFTAVSPSEQEARVLGCGDTDAIFAIDRMTWDGNASVTKVRILFKPGHQLRTRL